MKLRIFVLSILFFGYCTLASALVPEQGLWWNPSESGRGYGIEIQDNYVFITYYGFDSTGRSAFYTSGGTYDPVTNRASIYFAGVSNGQCFGCSYQGSPTVTSLGNATITFSSRMTGRIDLPGGVSIPIQRQFFFGSEPRTNLYGTWHLTSGALGVYFGQALWIQSPNNSIAGGFAGRVIEGSAQRILVGAPEANGSVSILVDSSTSYYTFYNFQWSINTWGGRAWTYLKTAQLSGSGLPFFGSRILGKTYSEQPTNAQQLYAGGDQVLESIFSARMAAEHSGMLQEKSDYSDEPDEETLREMAAPLAARLSSLQSQQP